MKPGRTVEMTGAWKTRKTKTRFPFVSHSPWKSLRDSHIPTAPAASYFQTSQNQPQERRPWRRIASLPPSGSFFNEKMLGCVAAGLLGPSS
jgi:hypothetical protein